jgi:hypothetical protein
MSKSKSQDSEDPFVKIYYSRLMSRMKMEEVDFSKSDFIVLLCLLENCRLGSSSIDIVMKDLEKPTEMSVQQISRSVKRLVAAEILFKEGPRHYKLNPSYLWRGKQVQREYARAREVPRNV